MVIILNKIDELKKIINESNYIVFFGGAGVSTASGIPDFRSNNGIFNMKYKYPPEVILSHTFFMNNTKDFYDFYFNNMIYLDAKPNYCHNYLTKIENSGKLKAIITQNIDGLHELAKSKNIYNLHGSIYKNHCMKCNKSYDLNEILDKKPIPLCECGGIIKPDVVLYEEQLNNDTLSNAIYNIENADTLIVCGTSLNVYPAAGLLNYFSGKNLVLINKSKTNFDNMANLIINEDINEIFNKLY